MRHELITAQLAAALEAMVYMYAEGVNSGDWGFWDAEKVDEVIAARAALAAWHQT